MTRPPMWVRESADRFWAAAGGEPSRFPRDLREVIAVATPLTRYDRPHLRWAHLHDEIRRLGLPAPEDVADRPLRAALYCHRGRGFVFLDCADPPDQQRFSLAHELAHYLIDYDAPRSRVRRAVGPTSLPVLDGLRPPDADERLAAFLRRCPLRPFTHLLGREAPGRPTGPARDAENRADLLAWELLAPADQFTGCRDARTAARLLTNSYGLPLTLARSYAAILFPPEPPPGRMVQRWIAAR